MEKKTHLHHSKNTYDPVSWCLFCWCPAHQSAMGGRVFLAGLPGRKCTETTRGRGYIPPLGFLHFLLKNRLPIWIILCIFAGFDRGKAVLLIFSGWTGLSLGILSAAFARQFSIFGILLTGTILVPQIFAYLPTYIVLIKNRRNRSALLFLKYALLSGIYVIGVICEYFLNPWFLQKIYTVMHVFFHNTP